MSNSNDSFHNDKNSNDDESTRCTTMYIEKKIKFIFISTNLYSVSYCTLSYFFILVLNRLKIDRISCLK